MKPNSTRIGKLAVLTLLLVVSIHPYLDHVIAQTELKYRFRKVDSEVDLNTGDLFLYKWKREAYVKISTGLSKKSYQILDNGTVILDFGTLTVKIYEVDIDEGGIEYEVILKEKPPTNTISLPIDTVNLKWYYQPPLDRELNVSKYDFVNSTHAIKDGKVKVYRPLNVVGSYAVYHAYKRNNEYKTGKAFHLYRPKAVDANGKESWLDLKVENGKLTITISQKFLDTASYPIIIDPTFGYDTIGASYVEPSTNDMRGYPFSSGGSGTLSSISAAIVAWDGNFEYVVYTNPSGGQSDLVDETEAASGVNVGSPGNPSWYELSFPSPAASISDTTYVLCLWSGGGVSEFYYDSGSSIGELGASTYSAGNAPDPMSWDWTEADMMYSIYCTYTSSGASYTHNINQAFSVIGGLSRSYAGTRTVSQSLTLTEDVSKSFSASRSISQAFSLIGSIIKNIGKTFSLSIGFSSIDDLTAKFGFSRMMNQAFSIALTVHREAGFSRSLSQSYVIVSSIQSKFGFSRSLSQAFSLIDDLQKQIGVSKTLNQAFQILASVSKGGASYTFTIHQNIAMVTSINKQLTLSRLLNQLFQIVTGLSSSSSVTPTPSVGGETPKINKYDLAILGIPEYVVNWRPFPIQPISFTLKILRQGDLDEDVTIKWMLLSPTEREVWSKTITVLVDTDEKTLTLEVPVPEEDGIYTLKAQMISPDPKVLAEQKFRAYTFASWLFTGQGVIILVLVVYPIILVVAYLLYKAYWE